jgi:hypothetical protein
MVEPHISCVRDYSVIFAVIASTRCIYGLFLISMSDMLILFIVVVEFWSISLLSNFHKISFFGGHHFGISIFERLDLRKASGSAANGKKIRVGSGAEEGRDGLWQNG